MRNCELFVEPVSEFNNRPHSAALHHLLGQGGVRHQSPTTGCIHILYNLLLVRWLGKVGCRVESSGGAPQNRFSWSGGSGVGWWGENSKTVYLCRGICLECHECHVTFTKAHSDV